VRVLFTGGPSAPAVRASGGQADARVPGGVTNGPVRVAVAGGTLSAPSAASLRIAAVVSRAKLGAHVTTSVAAPRVVFDSPAPAQLRYAVTDTRPVQVAVDVVRLPDGVPIAGWPAVTVAPGAEQVVTWDGLAGGRVPRPGTYEFRVFVAPEGALASAAQAGGPDATAPFAFVTNVFPVAGAHRFLAGAGRFGTPRPGGRTHQGQDVAAACGTPLVAARGGTVKFAGAEARAGNYVVVDADKTGWDMVYMHLRDPALVTKDAHVATGQPIGYVGATGDAEGCHLHFEQWSAPGWYTGGQPVDPLTSLLGWDAPG
jgi:murein DD-endopeptidase MepM/ murein hydrolase activator NlpD